MVYFNLLYKFLRLGPLGLGLIALAILAGGYFLQIEMNKSAAKDAVALAAGPPDVVDIADFDRDRDASPIREVMVQAQPVYDHAYRLTIERNGTDDHVFMVPLVAAGSHSQTDILGIAYFPSPTEDFANITPDLMTQGMSGFGTVGPVITYNGKLRSMGSWDDMTEEAFFDEGLVMPSNPVIVWPFLEGRDVALAPPEHGDLTVFGLLSKLAGAIGLLALAKVAFRNQKPQQDLPAFDAMPVEPDAPVTQDDFYQPAAASSVPLWKQRSGLVDEADMIQPDPQGFEPAFEPMMEDPLITDAPKRRFGVRKVLIGVVGGLFVLGLVSTIGGLISQSTAADQAASISTPQERVADVVADVIVPDAPTDRHWTDIDVTPVIEWVTAKALLAVTGDTDAMMTLAMIFAGILAAIFIPWWFLSMRRAFTPRVSGRVDSMGFN